VWQVRPIPGVDPVNSDCFVPSDVNYDAAARHPHEFRLSTSWWRADTGYELLGVENDMLTQDMTRATARLAQCTRSLLHSRTLLTVACALCAGAGATQGSAAYSGTRAYL
jgi:hypothetical protein